MFETSVKKLPQKAAWCWNIIQNSQMSAKLSGAQKVLSASVSANSCKNWAQAQISCLNVSASAVKNFERTIALPLILFHRHGHRFEENLLRNGRGVFFPNLAVILEGKEINSLLHGWKWCLYSGGCDENESTVVFKNIQKLDLYDIFQENSLYMSDYQVEVTIKEYFNYQGRELDSFSLGLELSRSNDDYNPKNFYWESEEQKWTKVVLKKRVSLKNVRYLTFVQEMNYNDLFTLDPGFPFGIYLPRATLKISFPMHQDKVIFHTFQCKCCF